MTRRRSVPRVHAPLLILHGFPTSSFDYTAVLDGLRAGRRVLLLDLLGYGLSSKPDRAYTMALQADVAAAYVAERSASDRLALLTHDMGDTVGGELLARRAEGTWPVEVTQRIVTNGSIYIEQAHLTNGQQMLLGLPDEELPAGIPIDAASLTQSLRETFSPQTPLVPPGWSEDPVPEAAAQVVHNDGHRMLPRLIRYIEERTGQRTPLHRGDRDRPVAAAHRVGPRRSDRRALHGRHAGGGPARCHRDAARGGRPLPDGRGTAALPRRRAARAGVVTAPRSPGLFP